MLVRRPPALRTDGSNAFARFSMQQRVPRILEDVLSDHPEWPERTRGDVMRLIEAIRKDLPLTASFTLPAPDEAEWEAALAEMSFATWLDAPWFLVECLVYRRLLQACRYWETGEDPFAPRKREELASPGLWQALEAVDRAPDASPDERIHALLALSLWGNRVDLSYAVGTAYGRAGDAADWLVDDRSAVLRRAGARDVHVVTDNTGSELAMDLALTDLLTDELGARVTLHVKWHPTFVSDATVADVWALLSAMREQGGGTAARAHRLGEAFKRGQLRIVPDPFWNGPRFLWDRPARLARELDVADLVLLKGDANYRRALGDAVWPADVTFARATAYFPAPLVCLRTMKSDALAGVSRASLAELDASDPEWRINGRRGLVQMKDRTA